MTVAIKTLDAADFRHRTSSKPANNKKCQPIKTKRGLFTLRGARCNCTCPVLRVVHQWVWFGTFEWINSGYFGEICAGLASNKWIKDLLVPLESFIRFTSSVGTRVRSAQEHALAALSLVSRTCVLFSTFKAQWDNYSIVRAQQINLQKQSMSPVLS